MGMDGRLQRAANDRRGLAWLARFGWLRVAELGMLLFPGSATSRQRADKVVRAWRDRGLVLERQLPERHGRAVVLAAGGVRLLNENGISARSGKDIGEASADGWRPSITWKHDLIGTRVLVALVEQGFEVMPERECLAVAPANQKIPDGLARSPTGGHVYWIEVEHARKSGANIRFLAGALIAAADGAMGTFGGWRPNAAMIVYSPVQADPTTGHAIDHRKRVSSALATACKSAVTVTFAEVSADGVQFDQKTIASDRTAAIARRLEWREVAGVLTAQYGARIADVWYEDGSQAAPGWYAQVGDSPATCHATVSAAKLAAASQLAHTV